MATSFDHLTQYFPNCRRILGDTAWERILQALGNSDPLTFVRHLRAVKEQNQIPAYLSDTALLEYHYHELSRNPGTVPHLSDALIVNPDLHLLPVGWRHLPLMLLDDDLSGRKSPEKTDCHVLIWRDQETGRVSCREAVDDDLLALKLVVEGIDIRDAAMQGDTTPAKILAVLHRSVDQGLLIRPASGICRDRDRFSKGDRFTPFLTSDVFTLQWHVTQACDLHCRHCYDRSDRSRMSIRDAEAVLDDFLDFTMAMHVRGHVTFTGGNPLLYPGFDRLYQGAADRGFSTAVLGNPAAADTIDALQAIQPMTHYQISLEGLAPYNDYIRGRGHFQRSLAFLDNLRERGVYSMVMLTLNKDNMDQVLPLAETLRHRADSFTFNRLAMVGEGENLCLPEPDDFQTFLREYVNAMPGNPILSLKDNLFNILRKEAGLELLGGCTGYGCGAAFNFISLLPDGEVHACRKFPSMIGNIKTDSLLAIYHSPAARRYRIGSAACTHCDLYTVCRGCPAVVYGMGLNCFESRDPFCFYAKAP